MPDKLLHHLLEGDAYIAGVFECSRSGNKLFRIRHKYSQPFETFVTNEDLILLRDWLSEYIDKEVNDD